MALIFEYCLVIAGVAFFIFLDDLYKSYKKSKEQEQMGNDLCRLVHERNRNKMLNNINKQ
jgi:hypothetical protein